MTLPKKLTLALCLSLLSVPAVHAQSDRGVYVGAAIGGSSVSSHTVDSDNDPSLNVNLGYRFNQNFSTEIFARSMSFRLFDGLLGDDSYYPDTHVGIAVVANMPVSQAFSVYGRLGVGRTEMKSARVSNSDRNETDPSVGLGVRYAFSPAWSLNLEATRFTKTEVNTYLFGVQYNF